MIWLLAPPLSPVSQLGRRHIGRLRKRDNLLTGEGGRGWARSRIIRLQECLVLFKSSNSLLTVLSWFRESLCYIDLLRFRVEFNWPLHVERSDSHAKCRLLKKLTCKGTLGRCLSVWEPQIPPYALYMWIQYTYSHREGGRGERGTREKVRGETLHKGGLKIPTWLTVSAVYKLW